MHRAFTFVEREAAKLLLGGQCDGMDEEGYSSRRLMFTVTLQVGGKSENMVVWLRDLKQFAPLSAMPDLGVTDQGARDIAALLYTLEDMD